MLLIPVIDRGVKVDLREQVREVPHQTSITKDNAPISIALPRPVQVGEWVRLADSADRNGWVIRDGLKPGDEVIVDGTARIFFPGAPVMASPLGAAPAAPAAQPAAAH